MTELVVCVAFSLLLWTIPYLELGLHFGLGLLYPLAIPANEVVAARSLILSLSGRLSWKGRQLARPKVRLV